MNTWNGILTIIDIQHRNSKDEILWQQKNVNNLLHQEGENFLLGIAFAGFTIPSNYYLGLDNRAIVAASDTLDELIGEPSTGGYERQAIPSTGSFAMNFESLHWVATSPIVTFRATVSGWGPVTCLFLSTSNDNSGSLLSTAILESAILLSANDTITMRIGMRLKDCTTS
jgi:hypothetical protein